MVDKKMFENIKLATIIISLLATILFIHFGLKVVSNETCFTNTYTDYSGSETYNGTILTNEGFLLQEFKTGNDNNKKLNFCYEVTSNNGITHEVSIVNQLGTVLGKDAVNKGAICTKIVVFDNQPHQYIGVMCDDCDETNYLYVNQALAGKSVKQITHNNTLVDKTAAYTLTGGEGCGKAIKGVFHWFVGLIGGLWMIIALMFMFDKTEGAVFKGW